MKSITIPLSIVVLGSVIVAIVMIMARPKSLASSGVSVQTLIIDQPENGILPDPQAESVQGVDHFSGQEDGLGDVQGSASINPETVDQSNL